MWGDLKRDYKLIDELASIHNMTSYLLEDHKIVANNITKELKGAGRVNLTTQKVDTLDDIAAMCKMFRDTRYETFRIVFVRDDKVVGSYGVTSKTPGSAPVTKKFNHSNTEWDDQVRSLQVLKTKMEKLDADEYYLIHNHPSGNLEFSRADISTTDFFKRYLPGYKDHILVGTNGILSLETYETIPYGDWDAEITTGPTDPVSIVRQALPYQNNRKASILLYNDARANVRIVEEVDNYEFSNPQFMKYIINQKRRFGATDVIGFTEDYDTFSILSAYKNFGAITFSIFFDKEKRGYMTDLHNSAIHDSPQVIKRYNV